MADLFKLMITFSIFILSMAGNFGSYADSQGGESSNGKITIIENVNVIPMDREIVLPNMDVMVRRGRIFSISQAGKNETSEGTEIVINGTNKWLIPGLADMHTHINPRWLSSDWPVPPMKLYLAHGVTAIRCFGPEPDKNGSADYLFALQREIKQGKAAGPVIYSCGPVLFGPVNNPEAEILRQAERGYDFVKVYSYLTPEEFEKALATATSHGIWVAGHVPMMVGLDRTIQAGMNEIAHIEELAWEFGEIDRGRRDLKGAEWIKYAGRKLYDVFESDLGLSSEQIIALHKKALLEVADKVKRGKVYLSSTLFLDQVIVEKLVNPDVFLNRQEAQLLPHSYRKKIAQGKEKHQIMFRGVHDFAIFKKNFDRAILWALKEKGVKLVVGTDSGTGGMGIGPGASLHEEMKILVESGYTPYQAVASGTVIASQVVALMTGKDDFGTISAGKRADMVLLGANPLKDIGALQNIQGVMAAGRWYDQQKIRSWKKP